MRHHPASTAAARTARAAEPQLLRRLGRWLLLVAMASVHCFAVAAAPRDRLTLLVPDDANLSAWQVSAWLDSAADEGIKLEVITDSAFLALGDASVGRIAGLIMPDSAHTKASDALVTAVKRYAALGGKLMLVFDAGVLDANGFYPLAGPSRFSDAVGVQYADYALLRDQLVGFGPVVGTKARLESLAFPPGKYLAYTGAPPSVTQGSATAAFVPTSAYDPGGTQVMTGLIRERARKGIDDGSRSLRDRRPYKLREWLHLGQEDTSALRYARRNDKTSDAQKGHIKDVRVRSVDYVDAKFGADRASYTESSPSTGAAGDATLQVISGYAFGPLNYFSFVTTGEYLGTAYLSSPEHGLVAGQRAWGSGQVLFVNIPLGSFKANGTDSAPIQGFLGQFAREVVGVATLSVQPKGRGGLIYNWHVDDGDDLNTNVKAFLDMKTEDSPLESAGPFSLHFTAGPDTIAFGDGTGIDLVNNKTSQENAKKLFKLKLKFKPNKDLMPSKDEEFIYCGDNDYDYKNADERSKKRAECAKKGESLHAIGSHGGWIHDYWGAYAETMGPALTPLLQQNFAAIEAITGQRIREYSSPVGNTPTWAVNWIESRGVVAMYLVADVGSAMVRSYREGSRLTNKLWSSPVTPLGAYATWEEFDDFGIADSASGQWLLDLQSFVVNHRTNRMFYNHPPGVAAHLTTVRVLESRANSLQSQGRFVWYTMTQLADFSQRRVETTWSATTSGATTVINASHPDRLDDITWLLPKARFDQPSIVQGNGKVSADPDNWVVSVQDGSQFRFAVTAR